MARLSALRDDGRLTSAIVRAVARSAGVHERTVWRWLAAGEHEPVRRAGWRTTQTAMEALYRCAGRPTAAWRLLRDEGVEVPSRTVFCDALKPRSLTRGACVRSSWRGRPATLLRCTGVGSPPARNEVWETDHAELDINVLPLRGRRLVRPWLTVIEDGFSRLVMGWALSLAADERRGAGRDPRGDRDRPRARPVGRRAAADPVRRRPRVPRARRRPRGRESSAARRCRRGPYSPHQKGKIERLHRTIGEGLIATLPHYTGGPRPSEREAVRAAGAADASAAADAAAGVHRRLQHRAPPRQPRRADAGREVGHLVQRRWNCRARSGCGGC